MANGDIAPPTEPLTTSGDGVRPSWYRYFVQRKRLTDAMSAASNVVVGSVPSELPNARQLEVADPITATDAGAGGNYTIGHADSGVTADTYGAATKLVILAIDAKGHVTAASEVDLNSDNVTEGTTNLFFTQARARSSISGSGQIGYNSGTGVIGSTGFTGGPAVYTNFTFVDGICTAAS